MSKLNYNLLIKSLKAVRSKIGFDDDKAFEELDEIIIELYKLKRNSK